MHQTPLSLLGCSGSLAFVLLVGTAANANTTGPQTESLAAPQTAASVTPYINSEAYPQIGSQVAAIDPDSDRVGDLAIAKFKCDCPACRIAVVQMLQVGQLSF